MAGRQVKNKAGSTDIRFIGYTGAEKTEVMKRFF